MQNIIVPFRLHNTWLGLDIGCVKGVESCGKISFMPNSIPPLVGLMQKNGKIMPIWSLFPMVHGKDAAIKHCAYFIEVEVQNKIVVIPVHEVLSVTTVVNSWVPMFKYGIKMYRSLDKKAPTNDNNDIQVLKPQETPIKGFQLEEIY